MTNVELWTYKTKTSRRLFHFILYNITTTIYTVGSETKYENIFLCGTIILQIVNISIHFNCFGLTEDFFQFRTFLFFTSNRPYFYKPKQRLCCLLNVPINNCEKWKWNIFSVSILKLYFVWFSIFLSFCIDKNDLVMLNINSWHNKDTKYWSDFRINYKRLWVK